MTILEALTSFLTGTPAIAAIVGDRVYPKKSPQGEQRPSIVWHQISGRTDHVQEGASGYAEARVQLEFQALTYAEAAAAADAVRLALDGFSGTMGPAGDLEVSGAFLEDERDDYDDGLTLYVLHRDYLIEYSPAAS